MKPIKLTMSAFGTYRDETVIDFKKIGENGLFLITGDTGAGKTTIFDAISFALFNDVSGSNRPISTLRSDFATCEETFVELEFEHKSKTYVVRRTVSYDRVKKSGEGFTKNVADASLIYDDNVITKISNVNDKIIEILGINAKQFKQISMLAQGEFLKILFAKSDERMEIFRKIFETDIYDTITRNLNELARKNRAELEGLKTNFATNAENIVWKEKPVNVAIIDYKKIVEAEIDEIMAALEGEVTKQKEEYKVFENEFDKTGKDIKKLEEKIRQLEEQNEVVKKYQKLKEDKIALDGEKGEIAKDEMSIKTNEKILASVLPIGKIIEALLKEIKANDVKIENLNKTIEKSAIIEKENNENIKKLQDIKKIIDEYKKTQEENTKLKELMERIKKITKLNEEKDKLIKSYKAINEKYTNKVTEYLKQEDIFFNEQAGIIAEKLEAGKPCPVCGSTEHPKKALKSEIVLTKEELDALKAEKEKLESENLKCKEKITANKASFEAMLADIPESKADGFELESYIDGIKLKCEVSQKKELELKANFDEVFFQISHTHTDIDKFEFEDFKNNMEQKIKQDANKLLESKTILESTKNLREDKEKEYKNKYSEYIKTLQGLGFEDEADYKKRALNEKQLGELKQRIEKYKEKVISNKTQLEVLKKNIKKEEIIDTSEFKVELENTNNKQKDQKKLQLKLKGALDSNEKFNKILKQTADNLKQQMHNVAVVEELAKIASGSAQGKRKIAFEQFVQATYFDMIIYEANKRLVNMTDNRYLLLRKKETDKISEKIALDLDVLDNYNGKIRDVKSLSGGESFKAALALALGLSDIIQSYSGGVVVDTLFIDEGFGTLDGESREQAINTLLKLAGSNKLIGIISHVSELQEKIDKKIMVSKTQEGSKVSMVY